MAAKMEPDSGNPIFTSMGMFIIDKNVYPESWNRESESDIVGGGGPYAIVGARMIAGSRWGRRVSGIIDEGRDFPQQVEDELKSWGTGVKFRRDGNRLTSRGINMYTEDNIRNFAYATEKKRIELEDLLDDESLRRSECLHLICAIERCQSIIVGFENGTGQKHKYIYEPLPDVCRAENLAKMTSILPLVDIFSPNLDEAASLVGCSKVPTTQPELSELAMKFLPHLKNRNSAVVLRCGPMGSFTKSLDDECFLPAYHSDQSEVIDVTGGGNSFCGGFMAGYYLSKGDLFLGSICGNLASGCIIEKLGVPRVSTSESGQETWNGLTIKQRFVNYAKKNKELFATRNKLSLDW